MQRSLFGPSASQTGYDFPGGPVPHRELRGRACESLGDPGNKLGSVRVEALLSLLARPDRALADIQPSRAPTYGPGCADDRSIRIGLNLADAEILGKALPFLNDLLADGAEPAVRYRRCAGLGLMEFGRSFEPCQVSQLPSLHG